MRMSFREIECFEPINEVDQKQGRPNRREY